MHQVIPRQPPSTLKCLLKKSLNRPSEDILLREHFFVNPASSRSLATAAGEFCIFISVCRKSTLAQVLKENRLTVIITPL